MKFIEFTVLSSASFLNFAPETYRSNRIIIICQDEEFPQRYRGNYIFSVNKPSIYYGFSLSIKDNKLFINKNGEQKVIDLPSEFAVRITSPIQGLLEELSYVMLYSCEDEDYSVEEEESSQYEIEEEEEIVEPILSQIKEDPVVIEEIQCDPIELQEEPDLDQQSEEELFESEEEDEEEDYEEEDYEESEG
jgi:hypothetical protein